VNELVQAGAKLMQRKEMSVVSLFKVDCSVTSMKVEKGKGASPRQWELRIPSFD
jgi:hypothetical protein